MTADSCTALAAGLAPAGSLELVSPGIVPAARRGGAGWHILQRSRQRRTGERAVGVKAEVRSEPLGAGRALSHHSVVLGGCTEEVCLRNDRRR